MKENFEKNNYIEQARQEITEYARKERTGEIKTGHFLHMDFEKRNEEFNADNLSDNDLKIWSKLKNETLTEEEFNNYRNQFNDWSKADYSRMLFMQFLSNRAMCLFNKKLLEN